MSFKHISTSVVVCSKIIYLHLVNILVMPRYFSHTEVLIIKVYRKKVLLIPPNPNITIAIPNYISIFLERLLRMCQITPKWLLEAKIDSYKLYDKSFLSLILKNGWVSDDVSLRLYCIGRAIPIYSHVYICSCVTCKQHTYIASYLLILPLLYFLFSYRLSQPTCTCW